LWGVWGGRIICSGFWYGNQRETDQLKDMNVDGNDIKWILKWDVRVWSGLV